MKLKYTIAALTATTLAAHAATAVWDGADETNWTTSNTAFDDTVQSGHALNWENVTANTSALNGTNDGWDFVMTSTANHTIGHLYMLNQSFDLATTTAGIETLDMTANFEASANANWSPVVAITNGGVSTYYRWNHSSNSFNGNGALDFASAGTFDLSQLGNATNTTTVIWGELNDTATGFSGTRDNNTNPNLQATTGTFSVGFIQWGASSGSAANITNGALAVDAYDVTIGYTAVPEPTSAALLGLGGLALIFRRRK